jgi:hypothetical protein
MITVNWAFGAAFNVHEQNLKKAVHSDTETLMDEYSKFIKEFHALFESKCKSFT